MALRQVAQSGVVTVTATLKGARPARKPPARAPNRPRAAGHEDGQERIARLMGRVVLLAAVWSLISIALRHQHWDWPTGVDIAFGVFNVPAEPSLFTVAVMFLLAGALRRRLRVAMLLALLFEAVVGALQLVTIGVVGWAPIPGQSLQFEHGRLAYLIVSGCLGIAIAGIIWWCRSRFPAELRPGAIWSSALSLVAGLVTSIGVTVLLTTVFPGTLHGEGQRAWWALRVALGAITDVDELKVNNQSGPHWVSVLAGLLSALAVLAAVWVFARSGRAAQTLGPVEELGVRGLLATDGDRDSLGYFATRRDKHVIFSPDGRAAVSYRVVGSVSLASADPIGRDASWDAAIAAWLADARAHGWRAAVLSASESGANAYVAAGLKALALGDEAIIDVDSFSLTGPTMSPVRQAVTRIRRAGYTLQVRRHGDIPAPELAMLSQRCEQWRGDATERGFSMALNRLGDPTDERCVMVTAHDTQGTVRGLLSFVPWGERGLSLDLMRRDRQSQNGLIEYLVVGLVEQCPELGVSRVSLNFAMFRAIFSAVDQVGAGPIMRWTGAVLSVASRVWQLETLYRSNAKYLPRWLPRFLCYDSSLTLSRAAIAAGMAEGFLPGPRPANTGTGDAPVPLPDGGSLPLADAVRAQRAARAVQTGPRIGQQQRTRLNKIERLRVAGMSAYPARVPRTHSIATVRAAHQGLGARERTGAHVSVSGRVHALRDLGGVSFAILVEADSSIQVMFDASETPAVDRNLWKRAVDLGDQVSVTGEVVASRSGELSVLIRSWTMAAKCLHPLPNQHTGLADPETRARNRHLDLLVNSAAMANLQARGAAISALRQELLTRGFAEVETPMLHAVHGGAIARPFRTHSNAYDSDLYLRIAPELYLKRLCVAGMSRIFELNRNFRNEGADATHNPEFTALEVYQAHADYRDMQLLVRELILHVARQVHGAPIALRRGSDGRASTVDLSGPWPTMTVHDAVSAACGADITPDTPREPLLTLCAVHEVHTPADASAGELVVALYEALVEKQTEQPTFYIDFPLDACPLTRTHRHDPRLAERWDLVAFGSEIATAYSELTDPIDQRARLTEQSRRAAAGDLEAMQVDEAFLAALEFAMPPTGGLGLGVDRLVMMLTGTPIRATLAFPFVRPDR